MDIFELPNRLTLNYKVWRCGADGDELDGVKHGTGDTSLRNENGYECCLGQFCKQSGVPVKRIKDVSVPKDLDKIKVIGLERNVCRSAIAINDNDETNIATKVVRLKKLFAKRGSTIKLVNFPKTILKQIKEKEVSHG